MLAKFITVGTVSSSASTAKSDLPLWRPRLLVISKRLSLIVERGFLKTMGYTINYVYDNLH